MRVVFLGTPQAAVPSLEALVGARHEVPLVVTQPDRPAGRSARPQPSPVKLAAQARDIEVTQPARIRGPEFAEGLRARRPDLLVVVAYGRILGPAALAAAVRGAVNVHFSLLPRYRGAAPVQWALARGEAATGVTTMRVSERLDEGDVLLQRETAIARGEHAPALEARLAALGAGLLIETLERLERGTLEPQPQDAGAASFAPRLSRADGEIEPGLAAVEIEGRVCGFDPWPGVWLESAGKRLRLVEARALPGAGESAPPGSVVGLDADGLLVACGAGTRLLVTRLQFEGRRAVAARDAVIGRQIAVGDRLQRVVRRS